MINPKQIREEIIKLSRETNNGHVAPAMSCVEILISIYNILSDKDRFIFSKGHGCLALYAVLRELGYNPNIYKGHPDLDIENGIHTTTGSLGHGLPIAVGMALARKLTNKAGKIYVLISDGELQEGTTWESLLIANHHKLNNLVVIIDKNNIQALDYTKNILKLNDIGDKLESFGAITSFVDGHNLDEITTCFNTLNEEYYNVIVANTIKGKGFSIMENNPEWHNRIPMDSELIA